jgi:hypothetical protein
LLSWRAKFAALESGKAGGSGGGGSGGGVTGHGQGQTASETLKSMAAKVSFPPLLPGEELVHVGAAPLADAELGSLRYSLGWPGAMPAQDGKLRLSTYQLVLRAATGGRGARHRLPEAFEEVAGRLGREMHPAQRNYNQF